MLAAAFLFTSTATAQVKFGIKGGVDVTSIKLNESVFDENNRVIGYEDELIQVEADSTIISISQVPRAKLARTTEGLEIGANGLLPVDENCMTTRPGVFGAGDVVTGAKTVVHAVEGAKRAAEAMVRYMEGE